MHVYVIFRTSLHGNLVSKPGDDSDAALVFCGAHIDCRYSICDVSAGFCGTPKPPLLLLPVATAVDVTVAVLTAPEGTVYPEG